MPAGVDWAAMEPGMSNQGLGPSIPPEDLAEALVERAGLARRYALEDNVVGLQDLVAEIRGAAAKAQGVPLLLLEVAEAFVAALARTGLGRIELELRRFVVEQPDEAERLLATLLGRGQISRAERQQLEPRTLDWVVKLLQVGTLRELPHGGLDLRPSVRALANDLLSPPPFRMWRQVQAWRHSAVDRRLANGDAISDLAAQFGVSEREAERYLGSNPLTVRIGPGGPAFKNAQQDEESVSLFTEIDESPTKHKKRPPRLADNANAPGPDIVFGSGTGQ